jgi:hypothetical protein
VREVLFKCFLHKTSDRNEIKPVKVERYALKSDDAFTIFEFVSEGPKGIIRKLVQFQQTNEPGLYNLAFGDKQEDTDEIDDLSISDNGDSEKVLATVVSALYAFFDKNPHAFVYATGSTKARTRLYRMGITRFYKEMKEDFYLFGQIEDDFFEFEIGIDYQGFLAQRKF